MSQASWCFCGGAAVRPSAHTMRAPTPRPLWCVIRHTSFVSPLSAVNGRSVGNRGKLSLRAQQGHKLLGAELHPESSESWVQYGTITRLISASDSTGSYLVMCNNVRCSFRGNLTLDPVSFWELKDCWVQCGVKPATTVHLTNINNDFISLHLCQIDILMLSRA